MKKKGFPHTEESKKKIGLAYKMTPNRLANLKKMSANRKGIPMKPEIVEKIKATKSKTPYKHTPEAKEKMKKRMLALTKEKSPAWKGGIYTYERKLWHNNKRRLKKLRNGGEHTLGEWQNLKAQYNWTCPSCKRKEPTITLSRDHIVPVSKGGSDNIENIQPLCRGCNSSKSNKTVKYD